MNKSQQLKKGVEKILFGSKWLLIPFYFGLILALLVYMFWYFQDLTSMVWSATSTNHEKGMLVILGLVDIVMVANLIKMIIAGSYTSFITKDHDQTSEKSSSGILKVKMSTSLIGVSSIHLLQSFIDAGKLDWDVLSKQLWIHGMFLVGSLILMYIEYIHVKSEVLEHQIHPPKTNDTNTNH